MITSGSVTSNCHTYAVGLDLGLGVFKPRPGLIRLSSSATLPTEMSSKKCMIVSFKLIFNYDLGCGIIL